MADQPKPTGPGDPERAKLLRVLVPAGAIAAVVVVVAIILGFSGGGGRAMSDGSDGSATDPGLKEIAMGVKVRDLKEGTGDPCPPQTKVKINYTGWLTNGTVFDSNKDKPPVEFELTSLIQGWRDGIPGMKVGGIRKLVIAADQAYGPKSQPKIPGGSTLIFEVELKEFVPPKDLTKFTDGTTPGADDPGLKEIGGGLKYRDLKEGTGTPVPAGDAVPVTVQYTGWLLNGKMFDSSYKGGQPITFELGGVVKGWGQGIPGMKPGGIRKLVIPAALAYGDQQKGPDIPPNSTLVFEVELIK